jgi:hypothetical protein
VNLFHILFAVAVGFLGSVVYATYRRTRPRESGAKIEKHNFRLVVIIPFGLLGIFLLFASVPGAFFGQPHWLTDKLYWIVERVIGAFT